jgi:hypothetical protein
MINHASGMLLLFAVTVASAIYGAQANAELQHLTTVIKDIGTAGENATRQQSTNAALETVYEAVAEPYFSAMAGETGSAASLRQSFLDNALTHSIELDRVTEHRTLELVINARVSESRSVSLLKDYLSKRNLARKPPLFIQVDVSGLDQQAEVLSRAREFLKDYFSRSATFLVTEGSPAGKDTFTAKLKIEGTKETREVYGVAVSIEKAIVKLTALSGTAQEPLATAETDFVFRSGPSMTADRQFEGIAEWLEKRLRRASDRLERAASDYDPFRPQKMNLVIQDGSGAWDSIERVLLSSSVGVERLAPGRVEAATRHFAVSYRGAPQDYFRELEFRAQISGALSVELVNRGATSLTVAVRSSNQ